MKDDRFIVAPGSKIKLENYDPKFTGNFLDKATTQRAKELDPNYTGDLNKESAKALLQLGIQKLATDQDMLYAQDNYALLIIFQAMDAAGKDGAIKHVMSGINPQGCQVFSFKSPSDEELDHDYLWRSMKA
ncbi:MAG: polyphosphate kinase 2 family protein, partial [Microcystaceae cyanobacterium]